MFQPIKIAFGEYMSRFYETIVPTNPTIQKFCERGLSKSIAFAPARLVDTAEEMLNQWYKADINSDGSTRLSKLPAIIVGVSKDVLPTARDFTRQIADEIEIILPQDTLNRVFKIKTIATEVRCQIVIFAHEEDTAKSLAAQFLLFIDGISNRRFKAHYDFYGYDLDFPIVLETPENPASEVKTDAKNITILTIDINLHATIPLLFHPLENQPNDARGNEKQPSGFPITKRIKFNQNDNNVAVDISHEKIIKNKHNFHENSLKIFNETKYYSHPFAGDVINKINNINKINKIVTPKRK